MVLEIHKRIDICTWYIETKSPKVIAKRYRVKYHEEPPTKKTIYRIYSNFIKSGSVENQNSKHNGRPRTGRSEEHIDTLKDVIQDNPKKSIRRVSSELNIPRSTVHRILKLDLDLYPYKIQIRQALTNADCNARLDFSRWMLDILNGNTPILDLIWFSDESHFHLSGHHVNSQNCRYWGTENPHEILEKPLHSEKATVWCAISSQGIIGPYFFEENERAVTVNGTRYRAMLQDYFFPSLRRLVRTRALRKQWFQQDGATCHTANDTLSLLSGMFQQRIISLRTEKVWPPHSPDLNPPDYFLWGYLKDCVYRDPIPRNIADLKTNITARIRDISAETLAHVMENFRVRMDKLQESNGKHIEHLLI